MFLNKLYLRLIAVFALAIHTIERNHRRDRELVPGINTPLLSFDNTN